MAALGSDDGGDPAQSGPIDCAQSRMMGVESEDVGTLRRKMHHRELRSYKCCVVAAGRGAM